MGNASSSSSTSPAAFSAANVNHDTSKWSLFVLNAYMIPSFMVNKDNATCQLQDERAAALGRLIAKSSYDIVQLQEMWGAGQGSMEKELAGTSYTIGDYCKSMWGYTLLDSVMQYANSRGGLFFMHNNRTTASSMTPLWASYTVSKTKSKKGMCANLYTKRNNNNNNNKVEKHLLVVNTHDDPMNIGNVQIMQMAELTLFIDKSVRQVAHMLRSQVLQSSTVAKAGAASAARDERESNISAPLQLAAVVVGDFNFCPGSTEYRELFNIMKTVPPNTGAGAIALREILPAASLATHTYARENKLVQWPTSCGRLDHIFAVDRVGDLELAKVTLLSEHVRSDVLVSDHYPFEVTLTF